MRPIIISVFVVCSLILGYLAGNMYPMLAFQMRQPTQRLSEKDKTLIVKQLSVIKDKPARLLSGKEKEILVENITKIATSSPLYQKTK
ncbi:MAG: hypothetical protein WCO03_00605 [bacterium]